MSALPDYQSFMEAAPEKGVIVVEYYWQAPLSRLGQRAGTQTSMVLFKRVRAADKCWCGSRKQFSRCHRRTQDWTYVTLDPDGGHYSPVVLLEGTFHYRGIELPGDWHGGELLPIDTENAVQVWTLSFEPPLENEMGRMLIGTITVEDALLRVATNSQSRFEYLDGYIKSRLGDDLASEGIRRTEPQKAFAPITHFRKNRPA